uniref:Uncharacterized protein n=1 Tax=Romanomermis culicivorax TaxID=13658 RepID=A0A915JGF4_ROMCU
MIYVIGMLLCCSKKHLINPKNDKNDKNTANYNYDVIDAHIGRVLGLGLGLVFMMENLEKSCCCNIVVEVLKGYCLYTD